MGTKRLRCSYGKKACLNFQETFSNRFWSGSQQPVPHDLQTRKTVMSKHWNVARKTVTLLPIFQVIQPSFAEHMSGTRVSLWTYRGLRQFFHVGFCKFKQPPMQTTPPGTCKSIGILHKAIFLITKKQKEKEGSQFRNCSLISKRKGLYMCDDWIRLNASCALYV